MSEIISHWECINEDACLIVADAYYILLLLVTMHRANACSTLMYRVSQPTLPSRDSSSLSILSPIRRPSSPHCNLTLVTLGRDNKVVLRNHVLVRGGSESGAFALPEEKRGRASQLHVSQVDA